MISLIKKLQQLLASATALDKRIETLALNPPATLQVEEIRDVMIEFGRELQELDGDTFLYDENRYNPLLVVNQAIADSKSFSEDVSLSLHNICQLKLIEFTFNHIEKEQNIQSQAYKIIQLMQFALARSLLRDPEALFREEHPVRLFFETAIIVAKECSDSTCPRVLELLTALRESMLEAIVSQDPPILSFAKSNRQIIDTIKDYDERLVKFEQRLIDKENSQRKLNDVRLTVHDVIHRAVEGKKIPTFALHFLHEVWSKYLYTTYLRLGVESPQWREGISDMYQLIWSLVTRNSDELNRRMAGQLSESLRRIKRHTQKVHHVVEVDYFFNSLAELQTKIIEKEVLEEAIFSGAEEINQKAQVMEDETPSFEKTPEVAAAQSGSWFEIIYRGRTFPAKLIDISEESGYLLFSDYCGMLGAKFSFEEYTKHIGQGSIKLLDLEPVFESAMTHALLKMERYVSAVSDQLTNKERAAEERKKREQEAARKRKLKLKKLEQKRREMRAEAERQEQLRQEEAERQEQLRQEEEERQERIRQERELKRELEEETRRQEEKARKEAEQKETEARLAREEAFNKILAEVNLLEAGGMIELVGSDGHAKICSLSMKLKRTGKLVFTDQTGRRIAEHLPNEFAECLKDGSARIIDYGATGDKRLDDLRWIRLIEELKRD